MKPYKDYTQKEFKDLVYSHLNRLSYTKHSYLYRLVELSFNDLWTPHLQFDGCTLVQDWHHPDLACFIHDWLYLTGKRTQFANKVFKHIMIDIGVPKKKAQRRYLAVSAAYFCYYKWLRQRKTNTPMIEIKKIIKF